MKVYRNVHRVWTEHESITWSSFQKNMWTRRKWGAAVNGAWPDHLIIIWEEHVDAVEVPSAEKISFSGNFWAAWSSPNNPPLTTFVSGKNTFHGDSSQNFEHYSMLALLH